MQEILSGVYIWSRSSEPHGYDFNGYLVVQPEGNLCVDPVAPDAATLEDLVRLGVARIVLTNRNHGRAANEIRSLTGAPVAIHPDDAAHARDQAVKLDAALDFGDRIGAFEVVDASGKSPGEVALYWPERRMLVVGDAIIGTPPGRCSLLPDSKMDDPARLRASVRRLLVLDFETLLVGDGVPILKDAKARIEALVATF
ncbi:MAG: MBL fold metallo-hydrolase [Alphaproteobacteria bacterium]|nr:MBL fold metallo-hydrolase [Alphaproteobacteria bacterium]